MDPQDQLEGTSGIQTRSKTKSRGLDLFGRRFNVLRMRQVGESVIRCDKSSSVLPKSVRAQKALHTPKKVKDLPSANELIATPGGTNFISPSGGRYKKAASFQTGFGSYRAERTFYQRVLDENNRVKFYNPRPEPKTMRQPDKVAKTLKPANGDFKEIKAYVSQKILEAAKKSKRNTKAMLGATAREICQLRGVQLGVHIEINHLYGHRFGGDLLPEDERDKIAFVASAALNSMTLAAVESPVQKHIEESKEPFKFEAKVGLKPGTHIAAGEMVCTWTSPSGVSMTVTMDVDNPSPPCDSIYSLAKDLYNQAFGDIDDRRARYDEKVIPKLDFDSAYESDGESACSADSDEDDPGLGDGIAFFSPRPDVSSCDSSLESFDCIFK